MCLYAAIKMFGRPAVPNLIKSLHDVHPGFSFVAGACLQDMYLGHYEPNDEVLRSVSELAPLLRRLRNDDSQGRIINEAAADALKQIQSQ